MDSFLEPGSTLVGSLLFRRVMVPSFTQSVSKFLPQVIFGLSIGLLKSPRVTNASPLSKIESTLFLYLNQAFFISATVEFASTSK